MSFAAKIILSMVAVVLVAVGIVTLAGGQRVRSAYLSALQGALDAQVESIAAQWNTETGQALEEMQRVARSPRLLAALMAGDRPTLEQAAEDELRTTLQKSGSGALYLFLVGQELAGASSGVSPSMLEGVKHRAQVRTGAQEESRVCYAALNQEPYRILEVAVVDRVAGEKVGALFLVSPVTFPPPRIQKNGTAIEAGLWLEKRLWGTLLSPTDRQSLVAGFVSSPSSTAYQAPGRSWLAVRKDVPGAEDAALVVVANLGALHQAQRDLLVRVAGAAGTALTAGLILALVMARGLSKPIAEIGAAAGELEKGNYQVRVKSSGRDEIGVLGRRFNEMAAGLALRDQYRRVLDTVADPEVTQELLEGKLDLKGNTQNVGILFCDIRGFTALTETMAPAEVVQLLNAHMTLMTEVAYAHAGTVDKFVGDLIMVTFGAPKTAPDDPRRMARCALAMIQIRAQANQKAKIPIQIGIGCAYGRVTAGCMGSTKRMDYTVLGERVNLAARLCGQSKPMQISIDTALKEALPEAVCSEIPPFVAKGFSSPVQAYSLEALRT